MRIVGGRLGGRTLLAPKSQAIRPTADRLREALFNILTHSYGDPVEGARVLDLFAGDGAEARALLRGNVDALGAGGATKVYRRDATRLGPAHPMEPYSLVFLDPPYSKGLAERALTSAREGGWLTPDALIVVEEAADADFTAPDGFEEIERREYGDTQVIFLKLVTPY